MLLTIKKLCHKCSKEFTLKAENNGVNRTTITNMDSCPHCGVRNDSWLSIEWPTKFGLLKEIGFNDDEINIIKSICEKEKISHMGLFRQAIRKFQGAGDTELNDFSKEGFLKDCSEQTKIKR